MSGRISWHWQMSERSSWSWQLFGRSLWCWELCTRSSCHWRRSGRWSHRCGSLKCRTCYFQWSQGWCVICPKIWNIKGLLYKRCQKNANYCFDIKGLLCEKVSRETYCCFDIKGLLCEKKSRECKLLIVFLRSFLGQRWSQVRGLEVNFSGCSPH